MKDELNILFVEDFQSDYELALRQLRKEQILFSSICVDTRAEFLNALENFNPDLIISDYSMPTFNGLEALHITLEKKPDIPFIVLTGSINEETAVECMRAGAADYVLKEKLQRLPFSVRETLKRSQERKEKLLAEKQLRESETRFKDVFESANVGKVITSQNKAIVVNQAFADMLGYTRQELENMDWRDFTPAEDIEHNEKIISPLYRGEQESIRYQKRYIHKNGSHVWVDISVSLHRDEEGEIEYLISTIIDITENKKAEIALRKSETRYRSLFEDSPIAIFEEDFSLAYQKILSFKQQGILDFRKYFQKNPRELLDCVKLVKILDVNNTTVSLFKAKNKQELLTTLENVVPEKATEYLLEEFINIAEGKTHFQLETINHDLQGNPIHLSVHWAVVSGYETDLSKVNISVVDITDRKKSEMATEKSEKRYRSLFEDSPVSIWEEDFSELKMRLDTLKASGITDFQGFFKENQSELVELANTIVVTDINQETLRLFAANSKQDLKQKITNIYTDESLDQFLQEVIYIAEGRQSFNIEFTNKTLDGRILYFTAQWAVLPGYEEDLSKVLISMLDITDRKKAEEALRDNEEHYRSLFEGSPVAIFEEDFSEAFQRIQKLKNEGISDFRKFFMENPDHLLECVHSVKITDVNPAAATLYKAKSKDELLTALTKVIPKHIIEYTLEEFVNIAEGKTIFNLEKISQDFEQNIIYLSVHWTVVKGYENNLSKVNVSVVNITDRKLSELVIQESEQRYRSLFNDSPVAIFEEDYSMVKSRIDQLTKAGVNDFRNYLCENPDELTQLIRLIKITDINNEAEKLYGFQSKDELNGNLEKVADPFDIYLMIDELVNVANGLTEFQTEVYKFDEDGKKIYLNVNWSVVPGYEDDLSKVIVTVIDITERIELEKRQHQRLAEMEAIDKITTTLREANTKEEALPILLQETLTMLQVEMGSIWLYHPTNDLLRISDAKGIPESMMDIEISPGVGLIGKVFLTGETAHSTNILKESLEQQSEFVSEHPTLGGVCVPIQSQEDILGVLVVVFPEGREVKTEEVRMLEAFARIAGITLHRMNLYDDTLRHLKQLQVQRTIDQTIASIFDLPLTLEIISAQARNYLNAGAAGILIFNPLDHSLHYAATNGFRTHHYKKFTLSLGSGPAGRAALSRKIIHIQDVFNCDPPFKAVNILKEENFVSYFAIPLIAKGELKGILEIFYRSETSFDPVLEEFLESLAMQTAIAIDNLQLFDELQHSNMELVQAYDATIEGWSRAMDLRDKETEEHTLRVTEMAVDIARIMGVSEEDIVHIRRGALLHDIGKMGVPDEILRKPGALTPEEWQIMKQHPVFAYEMIAPVDYLKPALDIPYCHHEKWDGTGYPRGLKGEEIPLAGRIFAVIDVWDALSSDRPYRKAWPQEKVLAYIKEQAGTHFDPEIVNIFLETLMNKKDENQS